MLADIRKRLGIVTYYSSFITKDPILTLVIARIRIGSLFRVWLNIEI